MYDYLITVSDEVTVVWQRKCTNATLLFLVNRYVAIFYGLTLALADQLSGQTVSLRLSSILHCADKARLQKYARIAISITHNFDVDPLSQL